MIIVKKFQATCKTFDTQNPDFTSDAEQHTDLWQALHLNIDTTVMVFLRRYFPPEHQIFENFGESFYYVGDGHPDFLRCLDDALFSEYMKPCDIRP